MHRRLLAKCISALLILVLMMQCFGALAGGGEEWVPPAGSGTQEKEHPEEEVPKECTHPASKRRYTETERDATCETDGIRRFVCKECNRPGTERIPATGHKKAKLAAIAASCEKTGLTEGIFCSVCGLTMVSQQVVPATGHREVIDKAVAATCVKDGLTEGSHCAVCGKVIAKQQTVPATGKHEAVVDAAVAATCVKDGLTEGSHCAVCGKVIVQQQAVPAKGHTLVIDPAVDAGCDSCGATEGSHCKTCGKVIVQQQVIPATGHKESVLVSVAPTCEDAGLTEGKYCAVCGKVIVQQQVVPATGHVEMIDPAVEPTCEKTGLTEGRHCAVCAKATVPQQVVPAKGHKEAIDKAVAATCEKTGLTEGKHCSVCNAVLVEQKQVAKKAHEIEIDPAVEPTCEKAGLTEGKHCAECDKVIEEQKEIDPLPHEYAVDSYAQNGASLAVRCKKCDKAETLSAGELAEYYLNGIDAENAFYDAVQQFLASGNALIWAEYCFDSGYLGAEAYCRFISQHASLNALTKQTIFDGLYAAGRIGWREYVLFGGSADKLTDADKHSYYYAQYSEGKMGLEEFLGLTTDCSAEEIAQISSIIANGGSLVIEGYYGSDYLKIGQSSVQFYSGEDSSLDYVLQTEGTTEQGYGVYTEVCLNDPKKETQIFLKGETTGDAGGEAQNNLIYVSAKASQAAVQGGAESMKMQMFLHQSSDTGLQMLDIYMNGEAEEFSEAYGKIDEEGKTEITLVAESGNVYTVGNISEADKEEYLKQIAGAESGEADEKLQGAENAGAESGEADEKLQGSENVGTESGESNENDVIIKDNAGGIKADVKKAMASTGYVANVDSSIRLEEKGDSNDGIRGAANEAAEGLEKGPVIAEMTSGEIELEYGREFSFNIPNVKSGDTYARLGLDETEWDELNDEGIGYSTGEFIAVGSGDEMFLIPTKKGAGSSHYYKDILARFDPDAMRTGWSGSGDQMQESDGTGEDTEFSSDGASSGSTIRVQEGDDSLAIDCDGKQPEETLSPTPSPTLSPTPSPTTVEIVFKSVYMGTPEPEETIAQFEEETYTIAQYVTPTPVIITEFVEATPPNFTRATPTPEPALMAGYCMMCGSYFEIHRYDWSKYYGNAYCKDCSEAIQYREVPSPDEVNYGGGFYKKGNCLHCGAYFEITGGSNCWSSWAYSYCKRCTQDIRSGKIPQPSADMFPDKTDMPTPAPTPTPTPTPAPTLKTPPRRIGPVATPKPEREYQ